MRDQLSRSGRQTNGCWSGIDVRQRSAGSVADATNFLLASGRFHFEQAGVIGRTIIGSSSGRPQRGYEAVESLAETHLLAANGRLLLCQREQLRDAATAAPSSNGLVIVEAHSGTPRGGPAPFLPLSSLVLLVGAVQKSDKVVCKHDGPVTNKELQQIGRVWGDQAGTTTPDQH